MSNTLSSHRPVRQSPALFAMTAIPERLLHASNLSSFKTVAAVPDTENAHATTNIDPLGPSTALEHTVSEIQFVEKVAEAEAAAHSEDRSYIDNDQTDKENGYYTDICEVIQVEIATLGVPNRAETQSPDRFRNHLLPRQSSLPRFMQASGH